MDFPCRTVDSNGSHSWIPTPCQLDWLNIVASLCSMYISLLLIAYLRWTQDNSKHVTQKTNFKGHNFRAVLSVLLFLVHLIEIADPLLAYSPSHVITVPSASLTFLIPVMILEHLLETTSRPGLLYVTASLWAVNGAVRFLRLLLFYHIGIGFECLRPLTAAITSLITVAVAASEFFVANSEIKKKENADKKESFNMESYRHDEAHFLSKATFYWLTSLLRTGYTNPLEMDDLGVLPQAHTSKNQYEILNDLILNSKKPKTPTELWKCYWIFMKKDFCVGGFFKLMGDMVGLIGPLGISVIVTFISNKRNTSEVYIVSTSYPTIFEFWNNGWAMAVIVFIAGIAQSTFSQASTHLVNVRAIHLKAALQALIYFKSLKLSTYSNYNNNQNKEDDSGKKISESDTDTGNIANLMSEDAFNIMSFFWIGHYVWAIPLKITMLMYLLHLKLGTSAVIGAAVTIITLTPLQFLIGKKMSKNASLSSEVSDERLQHINILIQGMKSFKLLSWEEHYCNRILKIRKKEIELLDKDSFYWALMTFFTHASSILVTLITFGVYYLLDGGSLSPQSVFAALALFNQLTVPLFIFPVTVPIIIAAVISTRRINDFLTHPETKTTVPKREKNLKKEKRDSKNEEEEPIVLKEVKIWKRNRSHSFTGYGIPRFIEELENITEAESGEELNRSKDEEILEDLGEIESEFVNNETEIEKEEIFALKIQNGVFSWSPDSNECYLDVKHLSIPKGKLTLIVGKIGSGKTSLLSAILGEMHRISGTITWRNNTVVAYCSQTPWLLNATVRDNILFGQPYRHRRYAQVLNACSLQPDLDILPGKDLTEIGEKGINLSGGQKQRIAIARALYSRANFVILDDPLSSLDSTVAMEVFENGIRRLVRRGKRTVLLVTHHLQLLAHCHTVIAMEDNQIRIHGQLNDIELRDRELIENWRELMSRTDPNALQGRTAGERWQLVKLVARIGRELKQKNVIDGPWGSEEENQLNPPTMYHFRRRFSEWKYMTHDLPLPTDECEGDVIEGRSKWRKMSNKKRMMLRATSLQARHIRVPPVVRQYSSPLMSRDVHLSIQNNENHSGLLRQVFTSVLGLNHQNELTEEKPKKQVGRLLSTESGFSDATSELDADEWEEMECSLGTKGNEEREYGRIPKRVYMIYIRTCGTVIALIYLLITLSWQVVRVNTDFWLSNWTEASGQQDMAKYLGVYGVLSAGSIILSLTSHGLGQYAGSRARKTLHDTMLLNIVKCPVKLFESTPAGRMFNRFSTDLSVIDKKIATSIQRLMQFLLLCCSAIVMNTIVTPWFLTVAIPVCLLYYSIQKFYRTSSRELQRLDSITRSPIFSHFAETLCGLSIIRAFGYQDKFTSSLFTKLDLNTNAFLIMNSSNRWLGIVLDYLGGVIVFLATLTSLASANLYPDVVTPSLVGLAINYTLLVPIYLNWVVKFLADCEMYMGAVERVHQYSNFTTEDYFPDPSINIPKTWPTRGDIRFRNVSLRYGAAKEPVINGMNLHIPSGQKVGICGRTGSGKSSLVLSLFNMIEIYDGKITIDEIDITTVPLNILRSRNSIIPQDVLLFSGSVRENLDPANFFSDQELLSALEKAQLKEVVEKQYGNLDFEIKGGQTLSAGQKQLFCLARAILHGSSLLIMDEATSNLDRESEQVLMTVAKKVFSGKTLVIIAHRLSTILDCDRIVVLDKGKIVEDGTPSQLLNKNLGIFSTMLRSSEEGSLPS